MIAALRLSAALLLSILLPLSVAQAQEVESVPEQESTVAPAVSSPAQQRYDEGLAAYSERRYDDAIAAFAAAHALEERADILFAWAQATRLAGQCEKSNALFERFLRTNPSATQVEAAHIAMKRCEEASPPRKEVVTPPLRPAPIVKDTPPKEPIPPLTRDVLGGTLVSVGMVTAVAGAALWLSAHEDAGAGRSPETDQAYDDRYASAQRRARWGVGLLLGGGAMLLAGGARFASLMWTGDSGSVTVGGRF